MFSRNWVATSLVTLFSEINSSKMVRWMYNASNFTSCCCCVVSSYTFCFDFFVAFYSYCDESYEIDCDIG